MSGQVNKTLVQQFRMPGYPFVLVTTDLLQEGEDLHTFCSSVHHYGIAWTPSSMEQRIGRIDRVRSQSDRRLSGLEVIPNGADLLQVYYPHLIDTVEVLQVQRILDRMNTFLRLMHEELSMPKGDQRRVDVSRQMIEGHRTIGLIRERLRSAFPIPEWALQGRQQALAADASLAATVLARFERLSRTEYTGLTIRWDRSLRNGTLAGTVKLANGWPQPIELLLKSDGERIVIRCGSPVGQVGPEEPISAVEEGAVMRQARMGAIFGRDKASYDLTVEEDVLLGDPTHDVSRVTLLLRRVTGQASAFAKNYMPSLARSVRREPPRMQEGQTVADWRLFCRGVEGVSVNRDGVDVIAADERHRRIGIHETAETYEMIGIVARPTAMSTVADVPLRSWRRNRATQLVGFRIDQMGRLVGNAWAPKAGLGRDEFLIYLKRVGAECDLFEYYLTGK
jgi:hypothetical protein